MSFRSESLPFREIEFEHEPAATFADYWYSLPKQGLVPSRRAFDPGAQAAFLKTYIIHELVSLDEIRIRLVGTKHREGFGADVTGRNYLDFVEAPRRKSAARAIHSVCHQPCGMLVRLTTTTETGRLNQNETFALPMRDNDGVVRLVYYQSNSTPLDEYYDASSDKLRSFSVAKRTFIDIGAGIPDFKD